MKCFNGNKVYADCIRFIQQEFKRNGGKTAIIGISEGKDSTIVAKLCIDALGEGNVIGVCMPNKRYIDTGDHSDVCQYLNIKSYIIPIKGSYESIITNIERDSVLVENHQNPGIITTNQAKINILPRLRMMHLYAIAQCFPGGRVVGTSNRSEIYVGWTTKWGDSACDLNPIAHLTCSEVIALGDYMGLPYEFVHKIPEDGLTGKSDEENLGFTYEDLDGFLLGTKQLDSETFAKIQKRHLESMHKRKGVITLENENA